MLRALPTTRGVYFEWVEGDINSEGFLTAVVPLETVVCQRERCE